MTTQIDFTKELEKRTSQDDQVKDLIGDLMKVKKEEEEKKLVTVTREIHLVDDTCEVTECMTLMKYSTMRPESYFTERHYQRHYGSFYKTATQTIQPRKFHDMTSLENFVRHLKRIARRPIEDAELGLLLRHITNGEQYDLICVIDVSDDFENQLVFEDIK